MKCIELSLQYEIMHVYGGYEHNTFSRLGRTPMLCELSKLTIFRMFGQYVCIQIVFHYSLPYAHIRCVRTGTARRRVRNGSERKSTLYSKGLYYLYTYCMIMGFSLHHRDCFVKSYLCSVPSLVCFICTCISLHTNRIMNCSTHKPDH